jgi:hypothetical protein
MTEHVGLLGAISEACEIQRQLGCSASEAFEVQRRKADERQWEREQAIADSKIVYVDFRKNCD